MSRLVVLLVGLLALSLPSRASFFPGFGAESNTVVLAVYTGSDPATSQLAVPPITVVNPSATTCQQAPASYAALIPELTNFKINPVTQTSYQLSFGCLSPATSCGSCSYIFNNLTAGTEAGQLGDYWVRIYNANPTSKKVTTYIYTDPACSSFVWPSTPLAVASGACTKTDYFTGLSGDATYFSVLQLSEAYYSIAAACDKKCQSCQYGSVGLLLPTEGANNCSNIVLSPFSPTNYTFFVEAELGAEQEWNEGRVVTVAIGVGIAAVLILLSIVVVMRSMRGPGYNRIN